MIGGERGGLLWSIEWFVIIVRNVHFVFTFVTPTPTMHLSGVSPANPIQI